MNKHKHATTNDMGTLAEDARELDGDVSQAADADNADAGGGVHSVDAERVVDGDSGAEQGRSLSAV